MGEWIRKQKTWVANNFRLAVAGAGLAIAVVVIAVVIILSSGSGARGGLPAASNISCGPQASLSTIAAGTNDNYALSAKPDTPGAAPSNGLQVRTSPLYGFDDDVVNHRFGHTFTGLPAGIAAAEVIIALKPLEDGHGGGNDTIELTFTDAGGNLIPGWQRYIGTSNVNASAGLIASHWGPSNWPGGTTFTLDLAALPTSGGPTTDLIPQLNASHFIDVVVQDDTSVDYAVLSLCIGPPTTATPTPSATPRVAATQAPGTVIPVATSTGAAATPTCGPAGSTGACTPTPAAVDTPLPSSTATTPPVASTPTVAPVPSSTPTCIVGDNGTC